MLIVRLLPTLFMKWRFDDYVLSAIDLADAFLMVPQKELIMVLCELAAGDVLSFVERVPTMARVFQCLSEG